jgi:hypothetical protein
MGYGALIGLGQGLQSVGGMLMDNNKQKLASKLDAEKEERAAARAEKLRQQQLLEPDPSRTKYEMRNGALYQVIPNKAGGEYEAKLASQDKIDEFNFNKKKDDISLEAATLGLTKSKKDLEGYDEDKALDREYKRSQIQENRDTGLAAVMRAGTAATAAQPAGSFEDAVDDLVKDSGDIQRQYTTAKGDEEPLMTPTEYRMVVKDAVKAAAQRGKDPRSFLTEALRRYVADKRSPAGKRALSE